MTFYCLIDQLTEDLARLWELKHRFDTGDHRAGGEFMRLKKSVEVKEAILKGVEKDS